MAVPWNTNPKSIDPIAHTQPLSCASSPGFSPRQPPGSLVIAPVDMYLAMAKCAAVAAVNPHVAKGLETACAALLGAVVDDSTGSFDVVDAYFDLVDFQRTSVSGLAGGGFAHLVMQDLGYVWCDQANKQIKVSRSVPLADFLYSGGPAASIGDVLVEAKGSIGGDVDTKYVEKRAEDGLRRQVAPHVPTPSKGSGPNVIYGYSVALGAAPVDPLGMRQTWAGAHVASLMLPSQSAPSPPTGAGGTVGAGSAGQAVSASMALGNHRANAILIDALDLYSWIDAHLTGRVGPPRISQDFVVVTSGDKNFIVSTDQLANSTRTMQPGRRKPPLLAVSYAAFVPVLELCEAASHGVAASSVVLPVEIFRPWSPETSFVLFRDGLAVLLDWQEASEPFQWSPDDGPGIRATLMTTLRV